MADHQDAVEVGEAEFKSSNDYEEEKQEVDDAEFQSAADEEEKLGGNATTTTTTTFADHFSLRKPAHEIRYRSNRLRVYELTNDQIVLREEVIGTKGQQQITLERIPGANFGVYILRALYTLVALLMVAMLIVFGGQVILFQCLEIPSTSTNDLNGAVVLATLLGLPILLYGNASMMVMATAFLFDIWRGHLLYRQMLGWTQLQMEWASFAQYLCIPLVAMIATTFAGVDNWWEVTSLAWYIGMLLSFGVFAALVTYHEVTFCWNLMRNQHPDASFTELMKITIMATTKQRFAGISSQKYLVTDPNALADQGGNDDSASKSRMGPYACSTLCCSGLVFDKLDPPQRRYGVEEVTRDQPMIVTKNSWSLEKLFCRPGSARTMYVLDKDDTNGMSAELLSTLVCTTLGLTLVTLAVAGFMTSMDLNAVIVIVAVVLILLAIVVPAAWSASRLYRRVPKQKQSDDQMLYQLVRTYTVAEPKNWYCLLRQFLDVAAFFLWPTISLYATGLPKNATIMLVFGIFTGLRINFNASLILAKLGPISQVPVLQPATFEGTEAEVKEQELRVRSRASDILAKVTTSTMVFPWMLVYGAIALWFFYQALTTAEADGATPQGGRPPIGLLQDFYYPPIPDLSYPSCKLSKGFDVPGSGFSYMVDYNMLAALSYETPEVTRYILTMWFGAEDAMVEETDLVIQWRNETGHEYSPISFKLFSIPTIPGMGVISIRGTETSNDRLTNSQLYMASIFTQVVRSFIPLNWLWSEIYDDLVASIAWLGSDQLEEAAYYKVTTSFVNDLLHNGYAYNGKIFDTLRITGVSLGGGLAMITGAQTDAHAVGISGINPVLGRLTFDPPLSKEDINTKIFNVHPYGDFKSEIGELPRLHETIECRKTEPTDVESSPNCHSFYRVMCEYLYTCGSAPRPVPCFCVKERGFPEPIQNGTRSFAEACAIEEELVGQLG